MQRLLPGVTVIQCVFKNNGKVVSVYAKTARGLMARYLTQYEEYNSLLSWDYARMSNLLRDDWIRVFRKGVKFQSKTIYCMCILLNK